jgi:Kef-type K+ transport system membrane component KefB/voltage-gated potassium channel Kch
MEQTVFMQLSLVLAIAAGVSLVMRLLRQPLVMGYILTGIIVGPSFLHLITNKEAFESFSQIGIALLLFIVGLGLNFAVVRSTGKPVLMTFLAVILGLGPLGFAAAYVLGFTAFESAVTALALLFSSTIIVVKSLSDKKEQSRLYAQIAIGILLVEDVVATVALLFVTAGQGGQPDAAGNFGLFLLKGVGLAAALSFLGAYVMPKVTRFFAASQEFLFIFAMAWALGVASVFAELGFSLEVGALFAGVTLASLPYASEISARLKPLRDFFVALFFIHLGEGMELHNITASLGPAVALAGLVLVTKPLLIAAGLGALGYTRQVGFKAAVHLSQISEFSIILVTVAMTAGMVDRQLVDVMTLTAMITIAVSAYLMKYDDRLYPRFEPLLRRLETDKSKRERRKKQHYDMVLFGYHKGGHEFVQAFRETHKHYVVVDYDPDVIETMERQHIHHIYGDATDMELLEELDIRKSEMVVSTITDYLSNRILCQHVTGRGSKAAFICHADNYDDAAKLYKHGATYVMLPHFIGSERMSNFIKHNGSTREAFEIHRKKHIADLGDVALR